MLLIPPSFKRLDLEGRNLGKGCMQGLVKLSVNENTIRMKGHTVWLKVNV